MRVPSSSRRGGKCRHACPPDGACLAKKPGALVTRQLHCEAAENKEKIEKISCARQEPFVLRMLLADFG